MPRSLLSLFTAFSRSRGNSLKIIFTLVVSFTLFSARAANNYYNTGNVDGTVLSHWTTNPTGGAGTAPTDFTSGDTFNIRVGTTVTTSVPWTISGAGSALVINGTFNPSLVVTLDGAFINNGTFTGSDENVTFGTGGSIQGTSLTTFDTLTINTTSATDVVSLNNALHSVSITPVNGVVNLTNGIFDIGTGDTLAFPQGNPGDAIINASATGNFANAADGTGSHTDADGGTIGLYNLSHYTFTVNGSPTFYNITTGADGGDGDVTVILNSPGTLINGTLTITGSVSNLFQVKTNSPIYGDSATLYVNNHNQQFTPGPPNALEWVQVAADTAVIGVTPGYPHNVTLTNMGTSDGSGSPFTGFDPSGVWSIDGTISIGDGVTTGAANFQNMTLFTAGGVIINNGSTMRGKNVVDKGNWLRTGATIGNYSSTPTGTVTFSGHGTSSSPQTITVASGTETEFENVAIDSGTYVTLQSPVTIPANAKLLLDSGVVQTSPTDLLSISNTATTGITGTGSPINYINGPVQWSFASGSSNVYTFPVGDNGTYLPYILTPNTSAGNKATVEAFNVGSGGTPDGTSLKMLDSTEYWSMSATSTLNAGTTLTLGQTGPVAPFDAIGESTTQAGVYSSIAGTAGTDSIFNATIVPGSPLFFTLGDTQIPLPVRFVDISASLLSNSSAAVQWDVADQSGITSYEIQRSTDDIHFTTIGQVTATNALSYSWTDANISAGANYYRIVSIDINGSIGYSGIAALNNATTSEVVVYPNPVSGATIGLKTIHLASGIYTVTLSNAIGQRISVSQLNHAEANQTETITPGTSLQSGTYYLTLTGANDKIVLQVIVQH